MAFKQFSTISAAATGTAALSKVFTAVITASLSVTNTLALTKLIRMTKIMTATGMASLSKVFCKVLGIALAAIGGASLSKTVTYLSGTPEIVIDLAANFVVDICKTANNTFWVDD